MLSGGAAVAAGCAPAIVVLATLVVLYACASGPELEAALKAASRRRDATRRRRGQRGQRSRYRPKMKLSQDGKGGRSANS